MGLSSFLFQRKFVHVYAVPISFGGATEQRRFCSVVCDCEEDSRRRELTRQRCCVTQPLSDCDLFVCSMAEARPCMHAVAIARYITASEDAQCCFVLESNVRVSYDAPEAVEVYANHFSVMFEVTESLPAAVVDVASRTAATAVPTAVPTASPPSPPYNAVDDAVDDMIGGDPDDDADELVPDGVAPTLDTVVVAAVAAAAAAPPEIDEGSRISSFSTIFDQVLELLANSLRARRSVCNSRI